MANELKRYVQEYLLHPASSFNVDHEGNEETDGQVVKDLISEDRALATDEFKSKLRAQNASLLSVLDPRYEGKKVSRSNLKKNLEFDQNVSQHIAFDDDVDDDVSEENCDGEKINNVKISQANKKTNKLSKLNFKSGVASPASDNYDVDDSNDEDHETDDENDSEILKEYDENQIGTSNMKNFQRDGEEVFRHGEDCDFSKYAFDFEEDDEDESSDEIDNEEDEMKQENEEEDNMKKYSKSAVRKTPKASIKKFNFGDEIEETQKGQSIKNQLGLYDSMFEIRIGLQKGVGGVNQLPQFNTFKDFVRKKDTNYLNNLSSAKQTTKKLLDKLLEVQEALLQENPETQDVWTGKKNNADADSDDKINIDDDIIEEKDKLTLMQGTKRKLTLEEYENTISKRHTSLTPYRNETVNKWFEKTKLLSKSRGHDKFSGFEVSALQQLQNILSNNKAQLIHRTQLTGVTRGAAYQILGHTTNSVKENAEDYDPEIFDDSDFYSRALEEMLKSKISLSDNMTDVSKKWIEIQKLRKKAKRKVDTRASKGRKLKYEVITKLQQYLAPCCPPHMDDSAINTLFASVFGKGVNPISKPV